MQYHDFQPSTSVRARVRGGLRLGMGVWSPVSCFRSWGDGLSNIDRAVLFARNGSHGRKPRAGGSVSIAARSFYHSRGYRYTHSTLSLLYMCVVWRCIRALFPAENPATSAFVCRFPPTRRLPTPASHSGV